MPGRRGSPLPFAWTLVLAACASPSVAYRVHLAALLEAGDYRGASAAIDAAREPKYGQRDRVLYWLDKAAVLHAAGDWSGSDTLLDRAEVRIEELYTKSLSQAAGSVLVNDVTRDYAGEPHERALLHVLRALNYAYQHKRDDAAVEARKVTAFLESYAERVGMKSYRDDAFAHYLSAMFFEDAGKRDDARISLQAAERAYARYAIAYGAPLPDFGWVARAPGDGEIIVIHYNGKTPIRGSKRTSVPVGSQKSVREMAAAGTDERGARMTVAVPTIVAQPYLIRESLVSAGGQVVLTERMEPIGAIATRALEDEMDAIEARTAARAVAKGTAYGALEAGSRGLGALGNTLAGAGLSAASATEQADTRCWSTLPAEIRLARLVLPAGTHQVTVELRDGEGRIVSVKSIGDVLVLAGSRTWIPVWTAR